VDGVWINGVQCLAYPRLFGGDSNIFILASIGFPKGGFDNHPPMDGPPCLGFIAHIQGETRTYTFI